MSLVKEAVIAAIVVGGGIQFVRPARTNPPTDASRTLFTTAAVPAAAADVLRRACRDCHSNDTRWPWYSNVAPVSWWVIDHVNHGRSHFNYSDWARYNRSDASRLMKNSCDFARKGSMPLPPYAWMHSETRLSPPDVEALCGWTEK
jgi:heme-binding protein